MKWLWALWVCVALPAAAAVSVVDDAGRRVTLARPAQRVISLSPHATELLFAAGGERAVVGVVAYSNWPPAARALPQVGDNRTLDIERIAALKPDLVVSWNHGNSAAQMAQLAALGVPVFQSEPQQLDAVPTSIERLGILLGTEPVARPVAARLRQRIGALRTRYAARSPVRVFYQVWDQPLMTLNGRHIVSDVIRLCGGVNVFADLTPLVPTVEREAVLAADPQAIITSSVGRAAVPGLQAWRRWPRLQAVRVHGLLTVEADWIDRPGPRLVDGATQLCEQLDTVRGRLRP